MYDYFITINTTDWKNSIYVPKSNGKITNKEDAKGEVSPCWYIDSQGGKWTTLMYSMESVIDSDVALLTFWAKLETDRKQTFKVEFFQEKWEERTTVELWKNSTYVVGKQGNYYLFAIPYTATQDFQLHFTLSVNNIEIYIFPATTEDLKEYKSFQPSEEESLVRDDCRVIACYQQNFPKTRFVGIQYGEDDRVNGTFGSLWGQWFENNRFQTLENKVDEDFLFVYPEAQAYIGLMRYKDGEPFEYWIGMFLPEGCQVPEGYAYVDFDFEHAGICWVQGKEEFVYGCEAQCFEKIAENGMELMKDKQKAFWFFERYCCPRFTTPDKNGEIILDIGYFVKGKSE